MSTLILFGDEWTVFFLFCLLKYLGHNFTNVYIAMDLYLQLNLWMHNLFALYM